MDEKDKHFALLQRQAEIDPNIEAFWLDGSRGKGLPTPHSDYDCTLIVKDAVVEEYRATRARHGHMDLDVQVMTLAQFREHAAWGTTDAWQRYNYVRLRPLVDKTGCLQELIDAKASVPAHAVSQFISNSLDGFINQIYRSVKCRRDGGVLGARLEAAESVPRLLDALFALNGGRLRPYYKYLEWELSEYPLQMTPWSPAILQGMLVEVLTAAPILILQTLLRDAEPLFRSGGYGSVFDAWGKGVPWIYSFVPEGS